jgi:metal-responsive CopG/Arc/MetJ family transcriptional regulator
MKTEVKFSVRLPPSVDGLLSDLSAKSKSTRSEIIRDALVHYAASSLTDSNLLVRRQITIEFLYLVADKVLADSSPEIYQDLMAEANRRAEAFYAQA